MAKSKSRSGSSVRRDITTIANVQLPLFPSLPLSNLNQVEDRRFYTPSPLILRTVTGQQHTLALPRKYQYSMKRSLASTLPSQVGFNVPQNVVICVRRKRRKEVLHALGKTGFGKAPQKRPFRSWTSSLSCK